MRTWWIGLVGLSIILAGCSVQASSFGSGRSKSLLGQTITIAGSWLGDDKTGFQTLMDEFEHSTGAKVNYLSSSASELSRKLHSGDNLPDIALIDNQQLYSDLANSDAIKPLDVSVLATINKEYSAQWKDMVTVNSVLYGVPFKATNKSTFWYNPKTFSDKNVSIPTTWEQLMRSMQAFPATGMAPLAIGAGDEQLLIDWFSQLYVQSAGYVSYEKLMKHQIPWTDPTAIETLSLLNRLWSGNGFIADGPNAAANMSVAEALTKTLRKDNTAAMTYVSDISPEKASASAEIRLSNRSYVFAFPQVSDSSRTVLGTLTVAVGMKNSIAVTTLLNYLASGNAARFMAKQGNHFISPNNTVKSEMYPNAITRAQAQQATAPGGVYVPDQSTYLLANFRSSSPQGMSTILRDLLRKSTTVSVTAQRLQSASGT